MQREFLIKERKHVMRNCAIEKKIASCILVVVTSFCLSRAATVSFRQWTGNAGDNDIAKHKNFNSADLADENLAIGGFPAGRYTLRQITRYTLVETSGTVGDLARVSGLFHSEGIPEQGAAAADHKVGPFRGDQCGKGA